MFIGHPYVLDYITGYKTVSAYTLKVPLSKFHNIIKENVLRQRQCTRQITDAVLTKYTYSRAAVVTQTLHYLLLSYKSNNTL